MGIGDEATDDADSATVPSSSAAVVNSAVDEAAGDASPAKGDRDVVSVVGGGRGPIDGDRAVPMAREVNDEDATDEAAAAPTPPSVRRERPAPPARPRQLPPSNSLQAPTQPPTNKKDLKTGSKSPEPEPPISGLRVGSGSAPHAEIAFACPQRGDRPSSQKITSESGIADDFGFGDDCPLCLDRLLPMWEQDPPIGRMPYCGKIICRDCITAKRETALKGLRDIESKNSTEKKQLAMLGLTCPLCRQAMVSDGIKELLLLRNSAEGKGWADYSLHWYFSNTDKSLSAKHLKLSAERDFPLALAEMAQWYRVGSADYDVKISIPDAKEAGERAAEQGHAKARCELALHYIGEEYGGYCTKEEEDVEKAMKIMELSGEEGYSKAYYYLGNIFLFGQYGQDQHLHNAMLQYTKGIQTNDLDCWYGMGCCYNDLEKVDVKNKIGGEGKWKRVDSFNTALRCFENAGRQLHTKSQEKMGCMLVSSGPANPKFFTTGICWMQMALNNGSQYAKDFLRNEEKEKDWSNICFHCHAVAKGGESRFHKCSKCRIAHYCSKQCQNDHWHKYGGHKDFCGKRNKIF